MNNEVTAEVVGEVKDNRPDPGAFPERWVVTYWCFVFGRNWVPVVTVCADKEDAEREFRVLESKVLGGQFGTRSVRIVRIPGETA